MAIEYFLFGIVLGLFGHTFGWKLWITLISGYAAGLLDEGIKVFLPTREFDSGDLVRDVIGVSIAVLLVFGFTAIRKILITGGCWSTERSRQIRRLLEVYTK